MTFYEIEFEKRAEKEFLALRDRRLRRALRDAIYGLAADPRPPACRKMVGTVDEGRIKVSDWRVIYRIEEGRLVVPVVRVGPRKDVYRWGGRHECAPCGLLKRYSPYPIGNF